jgi:hypothetical protein
MERHSKADMTKDFGTCTKCGKKMFLADMDAALDQGECLSCFIGADTTEEEYKPRKKKVDPAKLPYWKKKKTEVKEEAKVESKELPHWKRTKARFENKEEAKDQS